MNNKTKTAAGISGAVLVLAFLEIAHDLYAVSDSMEPKPEDVFKNALVYFIQRNSTGDADTTMLTDSLHGK